MDSKYILEYKKSILEKLSKRQLREAIVLMSILMTDATNWHMLDKLADLDTNYKYMLHYQFENVTDPQKETIYNTILRSLYEYTDDISDELLAVESSGLFYERLRIRGMRTPMTLVELQNQLREVLDSVSLVDLLTDGDKKKDQMRELAVKRERLGSELFELLFTSPRADEKAESEYRFFFDSENILIREKCLFISALTLNLFHRFDSRKTSILIDACKHTDANVRQRAIVGLVIVLQMYDMRWQQYPECQFQLEALSENDTFKKSLRYIIKQLIRSRETEEISRKMTEEIIPEMMKFSSMAGKKLDMQDLMGETDFAEKNPEWKKELEDSGLANKLQEYSNLQMEGADVFHSTFSSLKNFSFFSEISNWFLTFDINYSELQPLTVGLSRLSALLQTAVLTSGHMCDSDKYSFAFSMLQIPEKQRQLIIGRMGEESSQLKNLQKEAEALNPKLDEEVVSNQYIQSLYRFFKLYSRKDNFFDVFKLRLNFYDTISIAPLISDGEVKQQIANYCFDKNFFTEALDIYKKLIKMGIEESSIWQKTGYCNQMLDDLQGALDAYRKAELLAPQNSWIIKRIAQVYRMLKESQHSLEYYQRAAQLSPDNLGIELNIGHCFLELGDYNKALNCYFKVEVLDTKTNKAWRPIAWTAFLLRKFDVSQKYYERILEDKPNVHDFLNAGHVQFCAGNKKAALDLYLKAAQKSDSFDQFIISFDEDSKELVAAGADESFFPLLLDELRYKLD